MSEKLKILNEEVLMTEFSSVLSERMAKADWFYDYSDDRSAWHKGHDEIACIIDDLKSLSRLSGGLEEAKKLWEKHVPGVSVPPPQFFSNPKLLNRILDGLIFNRDGLAVQKILQGQQKEGCRFVVFSSDPLMPPKERFRCFSSRIEAENFGYEKTTWEERYSVFPIANLQEAISKVIEPDKRYFQHDVEIRLQRYQYEQNQRCSRSEERSR